MRGELFAIEDLTRRPRAENMAVIRALCSSAYLGDGSALCRVLGRYKMYVDTRDVGLTSHLLLDGYWEMWLTEAIAETVKPGMVFVDVGANLGYFALLAAELCEGGGRVHAFEPNPMIASRLRKSCDLNGFRERLIVHEQALADIDGQPFLLMVPEGEPKNAHIVPAASEQDPNILRARRFDSYPELLDADVVKIDAEAAEEAIWRGMAGLFARDRPLTIFLEFAAARYPDPGKFIDDMTAQGFSLAHVSFEDGIRPTTRERILAGPPREDQILVLRR